MEALGTLVCPLLIGRDEFRGRSAGRLSGREFEVARLIADGRTNAQIATALGISPRTAGSHVEHILAKLGADRRSEIATWVASVDARSGVPVQR